MPAPEPIDVGDWPKAAKLDPGGSIPIESMLPTNRPENDWDLPTRTLTSMLAMSSSELTSRLDGPLEGLQKESAISGEWARAMVFEMAGGEPLGTRGDAPEQRGKSISATSERAADEGEPSSHAAVHASDQSVGQRAGASRSHETTGRESAMRALSNPGTSTDIVPERSSTSGLNRSDVCRTSQLASLNSMPQAAFGVGEHDLRFAAGALSTSAYEDVFEQLDADEHSPAALQNHVSVQQAAIGATPLVLAFVLERIAASNSRRAGVDNSEISAWRPRRAVQRR
jgi:hypothetical protein